MAIAIIGFIAWLLRMEAAVKAVQEHLKRHCDEIETIAKQRASCAAEHHQRTEALAAEIRSSLGKIHERINQSNEVRSQMHDENMKRASEALQRLAALEGLMETMVKPWRGPDRRGERGTR